MSFVPYGKRLGSSPLTWKKTNQCYTCISQPSLCVHRDYRWNEQTNKQGHYYLNDNIMVGHETHTRAFAGSNEDFYFSKKNRREEQQSSQMVCTHSQGLIKNGRAETLMPPRCVHLFFSPSFSSTVQSLFFSLHLYMCRKGPPKPPGC